MPVGERSDDLCVPMVCMYSQLAAIANQQLSYGPV